MAFDGNRREHACNTSPLDGVLEEDQSAAGTVAESADGTAPRFTGLEEAHEVGIVTAECDRLVVLALGMPPSSHGTRRCVRHGVLAMPRVMVVEDDESV